MRARARPTAAFAASINCSFEVIEGLGRPATPMFMVTLVASGQEKGCSATDSSVRAAA